MSDRDGIDPTKPWGIFTNRGSEYIQTGSFDTAAEVITALTHIADPATVIVRHIPTDRDGTGDRFLAAVNRRMDEDA